MSEKIFEIRIVDVERTPQEAKESIVKQVAGKPPEFKKNYKGFAKVTYVTNSPARITGIAPIEGTIIDYFKSIKCGNFSIF